MRQKSEADKAIEERHTLHKQYRAMKRAEFAALYDQPLHGDRLDKLGRTLKYFGADDAEELVEYVDTQLAWLRRAPPEFIPAALELIGARVINIRESAGLDPFDDPLPDQEDDVWQLCKAMLMS